MHTVLPKIFIFIDKFNPQIFNNNNTNIGIVYRNYNNLKQDKDIYKIAKYCKKKRYKLFVANNIKLAIKVKANGVYLSAFNKKRINLRNIHNKKLIIVGSAHNQKEIKNKINQNCVAIFLSPIFPVTKAKKHLGIHKFNFLSRSNNVRTIALGGINEKNLQKLKIIKSEGFAGISLFKKKPAYKRPVF